ncbi:hypothetical protein H4W80_001664 [Nonomuraea angiospora]|uniref:Secreted protein n=1 Tax=Nonomuraea angiospora TaxID=46172 RepID=A0ABR9LTK1_9ACTN|nr:hypothetical protein [Nonomuraea angiospora]
MTTGPWETRRSSRRPCSVSLPWWTVTVAMAASKLSSSKGRRSATASRAGARWRGRWARIAAEGSTATTWRSSGSYEPAPAPTLMTVRAWPSAAWTRAAWTRAAMRGSVRRWRA